MATETPRRFTAQEIGDEYQRWIDWRKRAIEQLDPEPASPDLAVMERMLQQAAHDLEALETFTAWLRDGLHYSTGALERTDLTELGRTMIRKEQACNLAMLDKLTELALLDRIEALEKQLAESVPGHTAKELPVYNDNFRP